VQRRGRLSVTGPSLIPTAASACPGRSGRARRGRPGEVREWDPRPACPTWRITLRSEMGRLPLL